MAIDEDALRRLCERLAADGALAIFAGLLREESAEWETQLRALLRTLRPTDPEQVAEFHVIQGRISAYAHLLTVFREYGKRTV